MDEQISNYQQEISLLNQKLTIEKERSELYKERGNFYREQGESKDKLIEQHQVLEEKLVKEAEKKNFWKTLSLVQIFVLIGVAIGLAI